MVSVDHVADFLIRKLPAIRGWDRGMLKQWLRNRSDHGAIVTVVGNQGIRAVGIGVRCESADMDDPWTPWNPLGNCFYFHQVAAQDPEALAFLFVGAFQREPELGRLRLYAFRHGRKRRLSSSALDRLFQNSKESKWET